MQTTTSNAAVFVPTREDIVDYIWDVYKEVNGIRPRWMDFDSMSYEELDTYAKELSVRAEEEYKQRQLEQAADLRDFEEQVEAAIAYGAGDRATALRWMADAAGADDFLSVEGWLYDEGILFCAEAKALTAEILSAING